jgi:site-specific DNA-methyltransferase (adenine-specific)
VKIKGENMIKLINGDCLEEMDKLIEQGIKVDAIIADPPYGTTACKWDSVIPFDKMWERLNKIIKLNGAIVLFGSEPFSSALRMSNIKNYRYDWVWEKALSGSPALCRKMPLKIHENILVFYRKLPKYNPQMTIGVKRKKGISGKSIEGHKFVSSGRNNGETNNKYYPRSVQYFSNADRRNKKHPTAKPVALMEYLIKTYTNENETVLDFTMGSFTTAIACLNTKRKFIGIEIDEGYFKIGTERVEKHIKTLDYKPEIVYFLK